MNITPSNLIDLLFLSLIYLAMQSRQHPSVIRQRPSIQILAWSSRWFRTSSYRSQLSQQKRWIAQALFLLTSWILLCRTRQAILLLKDVYFHIPLFSHPFSSSSWWLRKCRQILFDHKLPPTLRSSWIQACFCLTSFCRLQPRRCTNVMSLKLLSQMFLSMVAKKGTWLCRVTITTRGETEAWVLTLLAHAEVFQASEVSQVQRWLLRNAVKKLCGTGKKRSKRWIKTTSDITAEKI